MALWKSILIFWSTVLILPFFGSLSLIITEVEGQQVGTNSLFPNASTSIAGNQSIVPGIHVMSLVNGVKSTWLIISSDNELSVNLRYTGNGTSPALSLFATALKATSPGQQGTLPIVQSFQRLTGSSVTNTGWISPVTVPIKLQGDISLYDAELIILMIIPNTTPRVANQSVVS